MEHTDEIYTMNSWVVKNKQVYKQDVKEDDLIDLVGKCIDASGTVDNGDGTRRPYSFSGVVVGYSKEVVYHENNNVAFKYMIITDEGRATAILNDMTWGVTDK